MPCRSRGTSAGSGFTGSRWDKSASDAACTSVSGLRQPGGDLSTFNQDVPGRVDVAIMGGPTLRAGPRPDLQGLAPGAEPARRAQPAGREPAADLDQPPPRRGGLCEGDDRGLHLRVADLLPGSVRVLPGAQRVVEHHPGPTRRPGQQLSPARDGTSTVTATSQHPLNVTAPTDIDPTTLCVDAPPQTAIPEVKDRACAAQVRGQSLRWQVVGERVLRD